MAHPQISIPKLSVNMRVYTSKGVWLLLGHGFQHKKTSLTICEHLWLELQLISPISGNKEPLSSSQAEEASEYPLF
jgi:hypothetical protein